MWDNEHASGVYEHSLWVAFKDLYTLTVYTQLHVYTQTYIFLGLIFIIISEWTIFPSILPLNKTFKTVKPRGFTG